MALNPTLKKGLEEAMLGLEIADFSGGLMSNPDIADLPLNGSPDCENVQFMPGRLKGRKGWLSRATGLAADADGIFFFYDSGGTRRIVIFTNGNLYTMSDAYAVTLRVSSVYTAGNRVVATELNSILYFSDGETIHTSGADNTGIRYYDPATNVALAPLLISGGGGGTIETPACKALTTYAGSLVLGNLKYVAAGTYAKDTVIWSDVNAPTSIVGTNLFRVGAGQGGEINAIVPMGIATAGISPFRALFVSKSQKGVFLLEGALTPSGLSEKILNAPVGCLDGASVRFLPGPEGSGQIVWLGTDRQVWFTNGVSSDVLSKPLAREISTAVQDRLTLGSTQFRAVRCWDEYLYVLDIGPDSTGTNVHYAWDFEHKSWTRFSGWPTGYWVEAKDSSSADVIYCADTSSRIVEANVGFVDGTGGTISKYWKSGFLRGDVGQDGRNAGDDELWKIWKWLYVTFRTDTGSVNVAATVDLGQGDTATMTLTPSDYSSASALVWDSGRWDEAVWASAGYILQPPYKLGKRLTVPVSGQSYKELLGGYNVQVTVADATSSYFEIMSIRLLYLPRGRRRAGEAG